MKLKRCPNLHYYDGDKYDRCPHCAAAKQEPAPELKPVMEPSPADLPSAPPAPVQPDEAKPENDAPVKEQAEPEAAPQPKAPEPPQASPQKAPEPEAWRCDCGAVSTGKFCPLCGNPKPELPKPELPKPIQPKQEISKPEPPKQEAPEPEPEKEAEAEPEKALEPSEEKCAEPDFTSREMPRMSKFYYSDVMGGSYDSASDDGKTRVMFEEMEDELPLGWLTVVNTSSKGAVFMLTSVKTTIGRGSAEQRVDVDLRRDRSVSRGVQATLVYDPLNKKFFLQSAGGKTFAYINREILLTYAELKPYDRVRLGETELVFVPLCCGDFSW